MPVSIYDLNTYKKQEVLVFKPDGVTFIDKWRFIEPLAGFKETVGAAIQPLRVTLSFGPRTFSTFDEAGTFTSALVPRTGTIGQGNVVKWYLFGPGLPATGLLRYQGYIDSYEPQITAQGAETITLTIIPLSAAVADNGIVSSQQFGTPGIPGTYVDPLSMITYWFSHNSPYSNLPYASPLTLDPGNPASSGVTSQYTFNQQDLLSIFNTAVSLLSGTWFWRANADGSVTVNQTPTTPQHQWVLGRHIGSIQYSKDWKLLKNVIEVIGAPNLTISLQGALTSGNNYTSLTVSALPVNVQAGQPVLINALTSPTAAGGAQQVFTSASAVVGASTLSVQQFTAAQSYGVGTPVNIPVSAIKTGTDIATFGARVKQYVDSRIQDQTTAAQLAAGLLTLLDRVNYRARVRIYDYRGDAQVGVGYDIETIKVGQSAQIFDPTGNAKVTYWDQFVWDVDYWDYSPGADVTQISVITDLTYGFDYVDVSLSFYPPSLERAVNDLIRQLQLSVTA